MTKIEETKRLLETERRNHEKTRIRLARLERELHEIVTSRSYKMARVIAVANLQLKKTAGVVKGMSPQRVAMLRDNRRYVERVYQSESFTKISQYAPTTTFAVVIHLYYPEMAEEFERVLNRIKEKYDLFISLPDSKYDDAKTAVQDVFPGAVIVETPNCGRDVLPFFEIARLLRPLGYDKVLKLHSKKSPHIENGVEWRNNIINSLVPDTATVSKVLKKLDSKKTAIIGPEDEYVSLLVNYKSTIHHIQRIISNIYSKKKSHEINQHVDDYGFFGGTMFWARLDSISKLFDTVSRRDFEPELGQVDSTMAHALERLLCVIPEIDGKDLFSIRGSDIERRQYDTVRIPEWAHEHPDFNNEAKG